MLQNAPNCTIQKHFLGEAWPRTTLANATRHKTHRGMQPAQPPKNWSPLANPAYAHRLLLRNLFEVVESTVADS